MYVFIMLRALFIYSDNNMQVASLRMFFIFTTFTKVYL